MSIDKIMKGQGIAFGSLETGCVLDMFEML